MDDYGEAIKRLFDNNITMTDLPSNTFFSDKFLEKYFKKTRRQEDKSF